MDKQEEYEEKIPWTFGVFPTSRQTKRKMMHITEFLRGFGQRFHENILSGPLV